MTCLLTGLESLANARALIVDDNAINRQVLYAQLQPMMPMPGMAENLAEAATMVRERVFDLLLVDLHLPDGLGTELVRMIRQEDHPSREALAIAITADPGLAQARPLAEAGYQGVLIKPVSPEQLIRCLHHVLNRGGFYLADPAEITGRQVLDDQIGLESTAQDQTLLNTIRARLAVDLREALPELERAINGSDHSLARNVLHRIAGGAAYCGAEQLKASALTLHDSLGSGQTTRNLAAACVDFHQAVRRTLDAIDLNSSSEVVQA